MNTYLTLRQRIVGLPTIADIEWLCAHPGHTISMIEIEGVFVPLIADETGSGPIIPNWENSDAP